MTRLFVLRVLVTLTVIAGANYLLWRWLFSLNFDAWWIAIPLVLAETYSLIDVALFGLTMWHAKQRPAPEGPLDPDLTVDVLITTVNEPVDMVLRTAFAAGTIRYPHTTWILDDGARDEMRLAAEMLGVGYLTRGSEWTGRPHHAKAGNLNNALMVTEGEFLLVLDADQVPHPDILHNTLGYFTDPDVALVQTPQHFGNVPDGDPLGSQAPLFYGPIQQGKDGWNAAFFCGSNAVLRREALMRLGLEEYGTQVEKAVKRALQRADRILAHAMKSKDADNPLMRAALAEITVAIDATKAAVKRGEPLSLATYQLQQSIEAVRRDMVAIDMHLLALDLQAIRELEAETNPDAPAFDDAALQQLSPRSISPLRTMGTVQELVRAIDVDRSGEAQALMPLATDSVTEDMATAMRLHARGWKSVYHHEVLATGLAPETLGTALRQRLRWAQGTMQVMLQENPLAQRGLSVPQRLMYFSTMWSYLSGFPAIVYFAAPVVFLCFGILPVSSSALEFFLRFLPFLVINQILFAVAGRGLATWRGQQYSLALFPVWIRAFTSALSSTLRRRELSFTVTDKTGSQGVGEVRQLLPQMVVAGFLVSAAVAGTTRLMLGLGEPIGTAVNLAWVIFDLLILSVLVSAVRYSRRSSEGGVQQWTFRSRM